MKEMQTQGSPSKTQIRKDFLKMRERQDPERLKEASRKICSRLACLLREELASRRFAGQKFLIFAYMPKGSEVDLRPLYRTIWSGDLFGEELRVEKISIDLAFPRVEGNAMDFYLMRSEEEFEAGNFGILEPAKKLCKRRVRAEDAALVVFPGIAFSRSGYRIGYGAGFYDRYFSLHPSSVHAAKRVGAAYEFQITRFLPEPHDVSLDALVSERAVYLCSKDRHADAKEG